jgi:hypothetical protein
MNPLTVINDIFKEHGIACPVTITIPTQYVPSSQRGMLANQLTHALPDHNVFQTSGRIHLTDSHRKSE